MVFSICIISVPVTHGSKNPMELELQQMMNCHVGTEFSEEAANAPSS